MTTIISRRDALMGLSAAAGAAAFGPDAFAQGRGGITTWNINNIHNIGGHPAFAIGAIPPKVIDTPAGKAVEFNGANGLILETNPVAGFENFTIEALIRPDVTAPASRLFHIGEYNNAVDALAPTATNNNSNRFTFETRTAGDQIWFESYNTGPGYASMLLVAEKKHPLHTWLTISQTYDGTMHRHYINGELEQEKPLKYHVQGPGRCSIGTRLNMTTPYVGGYMRMRFANRALPADQLLRVPAALKA